MKGHLWFFGDDFYASGMSEPLLNVANNCFGISLKRECCKGVSSYLEFNVEHLESRYLC